MRSFTPHSLEEALEVKAAHHEALPVAGGTDLMVEINFGRLVEVPEPGAPYGVKGIGEAPTVAATPAIVAALRAATGRRLFRVPVTPDDLLGLRPVAPQPPRACVPDVPTQLPIPEFLGVGTGQQVLMKGAL